MAKYEFEGFVTVGVHVSIEAKTKGEAIEKLRAQDWDEGEVHEGPWESEIIVESIKRDGKSLIPPSVCVVCGKAYAPRFSQVRPGSRTICIPCEVKERKSEGSTFANLFKERGEA